MLKCSFVGVVKIDMYGTSFDFLLGILIGKGPALNVIVLLSNFLFEVLIDKGEYFFTALTILEAEIMYVVWLFIDSFLGLGCDFLLIN